MQQDGRKLDDLAPYSDVTGIALSSVSTDLQYLKDNVAVYSGITVGKGFDILEDGTTYKKIPASASTNVNFSTEKITGIENGADVTGDHSADIIYNDVPDGPWTGNKATTFVKVTSADRERVTSVRGVSGLLYTGDDGGDITNDDIVEAYHEAYPNFWSTSDESEYRNIVVPKVNDVYTDHVAVSANRDAVITKVENTSADWDSVYTSVNNASASWNHSVNNVGGTGLPDGQAALSDLSISTNLTAAGTTRISGDLYCLSGADWKQGLTQEIDVGGTILQFIDGILVNSRPE
jgi:hypothetical protein